MDRMISQPQPSTQASSLLAVAREVAPTIALLVVMASLAIVVALLAAIAHGG